MPATLFGRDSRFSQDDIPSELQRCFLGKRWTSVSLEDWLMIGASTAPIRQYMAPDAYKYDLPSLIVGTLRGTQPRPYREWALEAILPFNKQHLPRGSWWDAFIREFDPGQRNAVREFARYAFEIAEINYSERYLASAARETIWV